MGNGPEVVFVNGIEQMNADVIAAGEIHTLYNRLYELTGHPPTMIVLHPSRLPGFTTMCGLPIVRSELAPKDHALVAWGRD